ncbi:MAG: EFR1 family ferrodoxin, partial [Candidatus Cloacimonetes bacterium]|nr:EFR1 family ferrodoxin [Candidatus Cloacimonadota bacterium]
MNKIFYFTGSGNSLAIAKRIGEKIGNYELIQVNSKLDFTKPIEADIIGFIFPIYSWAMPVMFNKFVKQVNITKSNYVFVVANYAGSLGNGLGLFQKEMIKKNIKINAFGEIKMPSNYVVMGNAHSKDEAAIIIEKANVLINDFAQKILNRQKISRKKVKFSGKLLTSLIYPMFARHIAKSDKTFFFTDKCNGCGICEKVCPVGNIILNENKNPVWQHHC